MTTVRCPHALRLAQCPPCSTRTVLHELQTTVDHLAANLMPGTARPWRAPQISADKRAELDRQAREDRLHIAQQGDLPAHLRGQGVVVPPGESPAPYDLDIADLLSAVLDAADRLADKADAVLIPHLLDWAGGWAAALPARIAPPAATSAYANPRPQLDFLTDTIDLLALLDPDLLEEIADTAQTHVDRAACALGLILDGQLLDAECPWCKGRTSAHPEGGKQTLRIRMSLPRTDDSRTLVVCEGGLCEPGTASGLRWKGLPAWDLVNEGDWLSECIRIAEAAATCRCGQPVLRLERKPGRPAQHCSDQCRRDAHAERMRAARVAS